MDSASGSVGRDKGLELTYLEAFKVLVSVLISAIKWFSTKRLY